MNQFFFLSAFILLSDLSISAVYRPTTAGELINDIVSANASAQDDIIDLQGNTFQYNAACTDTNCAPSNALPIIQATTSGGRLSIVNGSIERFPPDNNFRFFDVNLGADLSLYNIVLRNGSSISAENGGAIYNDGNLYLQNCTITNNVATASQGGGLGGAIYNSAGATLTITTSTIFDNETINIGALGGGIYNAGTINGISDSTIAFNQSFFNGGGIYNDGSIHNIFNTTISNNFACEVITTSLICDDGFPSGNGGGIYNSSGASLLQMTNTTVAENSAGNGAGIYNGSSAAPAVIHDDIPSKTDGVYIHNTTISANEAITDGGGIFNSGAGIITEIVSTIIGNNAAGTNGPDIDNSDGGSITTEDFNLISDNTNASFSGNNDIIDLDPRLLSLSFNGGFTFTMALGPNSPALNQGKNTYDLFYDQRGNPNRRVHCGIPDIGAYESEFCR